MLTSAVIRKNSTDHSPVFTILKTRLTETNSKGIITKKKMPDLLRFETWDCVYNHQNVTELVKVVEINKKKPWITRGPVTSIKSETNSSIDT